MAASKKIASVAAAAVIAAQGISSLAALPPPYKDGCSGGLSWIYRNVFGKQPVYESCCDTHDKAYEIGGSFTLKAQKDWELATCAAVKGDPFAGGVMLVAVTIGGQPFYPTGFRWGFGKDYAVSWWYERDRPL